MYKRKNFIENQIIVGPLSMVRRPRFRLITIYVRFVCILRDKFDLINVFRHAKITHRTYGKEKSNDVEHRARHRRWVKWVRQRFIVAKESALIRLSEKEK